jgi:serine/threonine-protein kinase
MNPATQTIMNSTSLDALKPGDRIEAKYEVQSILGQGGMGVVVAAMHLDLREVVALKFLLPQAESSPQTIARFLNEARAVRKLRSEHVVKVLDVGRLSETGLPYMTMEFLDGADLSKVLQQRGPLPPAEACDYLIQACDAISEAHAAGVIHRDIKPANLFAVRVPAGNRPLIKVLDFGIAKVSDSPVSVTGTQVVMGSVLYMSPEQLRSSKHLDHRTDIWALGVTLFELLTGQSPFEGDGVAELMASITRDAPRPLRACRPELPEGLESIILRCLEKSPGGRFETVADLAVALAAFSEVPAPAASAATSGVASTGDESLGPRAAGKKSLGGLVALAVAAALGVVGLLAWPGPPTGGP